MREMLVELAYYQTIVDDDLPMEVVKAELQNLINEVNDRIWKGIMVENDAKRSLRNRPQHIC